MRFAAPLIFATWILRFYIQDETLIFLTTLLSGFLLALLIIPYTRLLFNTAKKETSEEFFIVKEVPMLMGKLLLFGIAILLAEHLTWLFPIAGISYLYFLIL